MTSKRLSVLKVVLILARMRWRRVFNRLAAASQKKRKKTRARVGAPQARTATPRKKTGSNLLMVVIGIFFSFNGFFISGQFLSRLAEGCERIDRGDGRLFVGSSLWSKLVTLDTADPTTREEARTAV